MNANVYQISRLTFVIALSWILTNKTHAFPQLSDLSLEEKIGQMVMIDIPGRILTEKDINHIKQGFFGSVILFEYNIQNKRQVRKLTKALKKQTMQNQGLPIIIAIDQEGGSIDRIKRLKAPGSSAAPRKLGQGYPTKSSKDLIKNTSRSIAAVLNNIGINLNLAPVLDVSSNPKSFIYKRSYSANPYYVAAIAGHHIKAMEQSGVISTGKHFPGLGESTADSHTELPVINKSYVELINKEFIPFRKLKYSLGAVMLGHVLVPAIDPNYPASISKNMIKVLRQVIGYRGLIITDHLAMKALTNRYSFEDIIIKAVIAGSDVLTVAAGDKQEINTIQIIADAVRQGQIPISRINEATQKILNIKRHIIGQHKP